MKTLLQSIVLAVLLVVMVKNSDAVCFDAACVQARNAAAAASSTSHVAAAVAVPTAAAPTSLTDKLTADLTKAIADATAAKDIAAPMRLACWTTLLALVPALPVIPSGSLSEPAGVFDAYELAAEKVEQVIVLADYQIPPEVKLKIQIACGPLAARANDVLLQFNVKLVRLGATISLMPK